MADHSGHFLDFSGIEIPYVKVAPSSGEEDFIAVGWEKEGGGKGRLAEVETCKKWIRICWMG